MNTAPVSQTAAAFDAPETPSRWWALRARLRQVRGAIGQKANEALHFLVVDLLRSKAFVDMHLHTYPSYEEYRAVQILHNRRKIGRVWADAHTLDAIAVRLDALFGDGPILGLCHGTRNGFEQNHFNAVSPGYRVTGTDISPTAADYPNSVQWDFHDENPDWLGRFDFVYSNSLDQSWQPRQALATWLGQLKPGGVLVLEYSDEQGPIAAGEMDPFGVRPEVVPYVLAQWFGHGVSVAVEQGHKANIGKPNWVFYIRRTGHPLADQG